MIRGVFSFERLVITFSLLITVGGVSIAWAASL